MPFARAACRAGSVATTHRSTSEQNQATGGVTGSVTTEINGARLPAERRIRRGKLICSGWTLMTRSGCVVMSGGVICRRTSGKVASSAHSTRSREEPNR
jgi:hypothetical protein